MKFHDTLIGVALVAFGLWITITAWGFPKLTGQPIGPGTLPVVLGSLCVLGGATLGLQGLRSGDRLATIHEGWRMPGRVLSAAVALLGALLLALTFETVGFPLGGSLLLVAVYLASGHRHPGWIAFSGMFVILVHLLLTRLLQVPLPAGLLAGVL